MKSAGKEEKERREPREAFSPLVVTGRGGAVAVIDKVTTEALIGARPHGNLVLTPLGVDCVLTRTSI